MAISWRSQRTSIWVPADTFRRMEDCREQRVSRCRGRVRGLLPVAISHRVYSLDMPRPAHQADAGRSDVLVTFQSEMIPERENRTLGSATVEGKLGQCGD